MRVLRIAGLLLSLRALSALGVRHRRNNETAASRSQCGWTQKPKNTNPFAGETLYVNPSYRVLLQSSIDITSGTTRETMQKMQNVPSAFWIDVKSKIYKSDMHPDLSTVEGILEDAALCDPPHLVTFMVYDLPNRDCHALASNGEICCHYGENVGRTGCEMGGNGFYKEYPGENCRDGLEEYKTTYIDPFAEVVKRYDNIVPIVLIIEPDSLPNQATNQGNRGCHAETQTAYEEGIKYAVEKFSQTNAHMYLDAAHGGWLGWIQDAESFAAQVARMGVAPHLRGFATNTANYQATGIEACSTFGQCRGGQGGNATCCATDPCDLQGQYNYGHDETNYVDMMDNVFRAAIPGFEPYFVIDTGRNGKPDARQSCSNWCNPRGNGVGSVPTVDTSDPRIDALHWLKTPGESDGCTRELPDGTTCPRFDQACASTDSLGSQYGEPRAPEAGLWYHYQIAQLADNADLGDAWWVDLYNSGSLTCRAPDGGCGGVMPPSPGGSPAGPGWGGSPTQAPTPTQPTPTPTQPCTDNNQYCADWAANGECETNPNYMLVTCPESCGACPQPTPTPQPTPAPTAAPTPAPPPPPTPAPPPPPTPGPPPPPPPTPAPQPCTDNNQYCEDWAANGECQTNPNYMLTNCRKSCGVCSGPGPQPTPAPPPPTAAPSPQPTPPAGAGQCCYEGCGKQCQGGWCGESQSNCEGTCFGEWCPR